MSDSIIYEYQYIDDMLPEDPYPLAGGIGPGMIMFGAVAASVLLIIFLLVVTDGVSYPLSTMGNPGTGLGGEVNNMTTAKDDQVVYAGCSVSPNFPPGVAQWCELITHYANKHSLQPDLVAALIWQESGGSPEAYSHSGAVGLMQVMPRDGLAASFMCKNGPCFSDRPTIDELKDPEFNISYGTRMLASLLAQRGNIREALKSYGPMDVGYYYADKVLGIYKQYGKH